MCSMRFILVTFWLDIFEKWIYQKVDSASTGFLNVFQNLDHCSGFRTCNLSACSSIYRLYSFQHSWTRVKCVCHFFHPCEPSKTLTCNNQSKSIHFPLIFFFTSICSSTKFHAVVLVHHFPTTTSTAIGDDLSGSLGRRLYNCVNCPCEFKL